MHDENYSHRVVLAHRPSYTRPTRRQMSSGSTSPQSDTKTKKRTSLEVLFLWCHRDSNQGHKDFQSFALPTELWHHHLCLTFLKRVQRYTLFSYLQTFLQKLFHIFSPSMQQNLIQPYIPTIYSRDKNTKKSTEITASILEFDNTELFRKSFTPLFFEHITNENREVGVAFGEAELVSDVGTLVVVSRLTRVGLDVLTL